ncbi:hypothetical protein ACJX0J_024590, partial [Zea mays]
TSQVAVSFSQHAMDISGKTRNKRRMTNLVVVIFIKTVAATILYIDTYQPFLLPRHFVLDAEDFIHYPICGNHISNKQQRTLFIMEIQLSDSKINFPVPSYLLGLLWYRGFKIKKTSWLTL